jgi:prepilin-type N-terminal cleavage/methylation domain-containing protein
MRRADTNRRLAAGFTLIELLVVIGIIVLLVGLLLPAVTKVREAGTRTRVRAEIGEMSTAIESFKSTFQVNCLPTGFILSSDYSQSNAAPLQESYQYYSKVWGKAFIPGQPGKTPLPPNLPSAAPNNPLNIFMDGNQALVFFLGGIGPGFPDQDPSYAPYRPAFIGGNRTGFLNSPTNPFGYQTPPNVATPGWYPPADGSKAKGPFFDFKPERINSSGQFLDPYGTPYIYMSSKNGNDYGVFKVYAGAIPGFNADGGWGNVSPFVGIDGKYINAQGFQIISAGRNLQFGPGSPVVGGVPTVFDPGVGQYSPGAAGGDDLSNWARGMLGGD